MRIDESHACLQKKDLPFLKAAWDIVGEPFDARQASYDEFNTCKNIMSCCYMAAALPKDILTSGSNPTTHARIVTALQCSNTLEGGNNQAHQATCNKP